MYPTCRFGVTRQRDLDAGAVCVDASIPDYDLGSISKRLLMLDRRCPYDQGRSQSWDIPELSNLRLAQAFGLTSEKNLYPGMRLVLVDWNKPELKITPWRHLRGSGFEPWSKLWPEKQPRVIPYEAPDEVWGATIREALAQA